MTAIAGKRVLVTGGARGIGRQMALLCARRGAVVVLWDLDADQAVLVVPGEVVSVAFFPDGERIVLGTRRDGAAIYQVGSPEPLKVLEEGGGALALSADGALLAAVTGRDVTVWETEKTACTYPAGASLP